MLKLKTKDEIAQGAKPGVALTALEQMILKYQPVALNEAQEFRTELFNALADVKNATEFDIAAERSKPNDCVWFEVWSNNNGFPSWYWRLWSRNGRIIADGGEGYTEKASAVKAAQRIIKHLSTGTIEIKEVQ